MKPTLQLFVASLLTAVAIFNVIFALNHVDSSSVSNSFDNLKSEFARGRMKDGGVVSPKLRSDQKKAVIDKVEASSVAVNEKITKEVSTVTASHENNSVDGFVRHDNVVIVTKIHDENQWSMVEQSLCLLHYAYNHKLLYDIVIFSTELVSEEKVQELQDVLSPTKLRVVVDNKGLQNEIADLPPAKHEFLKKMCNVTDTSTLDWYTSCENNRLAYNWQAEFRSLRIWHHPDLAPYKTMFWLDTDGFATKPFEKDPIDYFVNNKGVIMFDHFPQSSARPYLQKRVYEGFNATLCKLKLDEETGNLKPEYGAGDKCHERGIPLIHGFFHITDLDFYRSPLVTKGLESIFGDCFLCRVPDDQLAVTIAPAMIAPELTFDMRSKGFRFDMFHNSKVDGHERTVPRGFLQYWDQIGQHQLPSAAGVCKVVNSK